jgi:Helix-turn-helix domain
MSEKVIQEAYFAIVPEWVIDANISDRAVRLYAALARYANAEHQAWPSRATLADRLRCSAASVDRAILELVSAGALTTTARFVPGTTERTSNLYTLKVSAPVQRGLLTREDTPSSPVTTPLLTGDEVTKANNYSQLNQTRSATGHLGVQAQKHLTSVIAEGISQDDAERAAAWLSDNDLPIAAFRIKAYLEGKEQPPAPRKAPPNPDAKTDWSKESDQW